jgi:uncharacterized membrane protein YsdA (DUF1294 family)/cold shock CspA family protein
MRIEGLVKSWNDDRGFGFIAPTQGGDEIFVHIKAFRARAGRPQVGQYVSFEIEQVQTGKKRAKDVELMRVTHGRPRRFESSASWGNISLLAIPAFATLFFLVSVFWRVPLFVAGVYLALSAASFVAYAADKSAANSGGWRTRESTLLLLGLMGGWPGGLIARKFLRHKSAKVSFRTAFWGSVAINVCGFVVLSSPLVNAWARLPA